MAILGLHVRKIHSGIIPYWVFLWYIYVGLNADEDTAQQSCRLLGFPCLSVCNVRRIQRVSLGSHVFVLNLEWSKSIGGPVKANLRQTFTTFSIKSPKRDHSRQTDYPTRIGIERGYLIRTYCYTQVVCLLKITNVWFISYHIISQIAYIS